MFQGDTFIGMVPKANALTAQDRPYKKALPLDECEAVLMKTAGKMYDPALIEAARRSRACQTRRKLLASRRTRSPTCRPSTWLRSKVRVMPLSRRMLTR